MKIQKIVLIATLLAILTQACDVLNVEPSQSISAEGAISNANDLERALMGCYDGLQSASYYGRDYLIVPDLLADNLDWRGTSQDYGAINNNSLSSDLFLVENIWSSIYTVINRANNALYYLPGVENISDDDLGNYKGELMFIRALCYFDLARLFGGVPLRTLPTLDASESLHVARTPQADIYQFVIDELEDAYSLILNSQVGRATPAAAKALLARAYLYAGDYENAWTAANDVIENSAYGFSLEDYYGTIFQEAFSVESIFEIEFNEQDGNRIAQYFALAPTGRYEFGPYTELVYSYPEDDERLLASIDTTEIESSAVIKYSDVQQGSDNVIVLRFAEMYLIRAEAEANKETPVLSSIIADINEVRERAGIGETDAATLQELKDEILQQRRLEFAFDGYRWFDLIRFGKAVEVLPNVTSTNQLLFPIPQTEILSNNKINQDDQNPGY